MFCNILNFPVIQCLNEQVHKVLSQLRKFMEIKSLCFVQEMKEKKRLTIYIVRKLGKDQEIQIN